VFILLCNESARETDGIFRKFFDFNFLRPDDKLLLVTFELIVFVAMPQFSQELIITLTILLELLKVLKFLLIEDCFKRLVHNNEYL
jgi:hypothetical protein